ncbi:class I SAM-dependent methyltransferase [Streptomyces iconiensis]|uniref:Class I SAM-dependent methyltransferase n=1 Tax=Streptomyces iconiensis TaxID=1384038 RepID=A0ABT7A3V5_9ACTN|nr:class I SAM-dependent methyltransferase [Streptomyces iconiensis]MDJ1136023.1 class I SAM-dependent methyltransferase [Streptomyces iconiensis]
MVYEHPLAYVLGLEGIALMRAFAGEYDRDFTEARIAEVRRLLDDASLAHGGVEAARLEPPEGYGIWADTYDAPNPAFGFDEPLVTRIAARLPSGVALDAACGTGRIAALLAGYGHRVLGVDSSPGMLDRARLRVPEGDFRAGDLRELPVDDRAVDLAVCSLALTHVPELRPVLAEFARVLQPGGQLVLTDVHPERVARCMIPTVRRPDGSPGRPASYVHRTGDYLRAALSAGLQVCACDEPEMPPAEPRAPREEPDWPGPWDVWPWSLAGLVREAADAAGAGVPAMLQWHFRKPGPPGAD